MSRNGVTVYLPKELEAKVERLAFMQHRSVSSIITQAVRARIGDERDDGSVEALIDVVARRLDARLDKAIGEQLILKEIVLLFVRIWFEHNPPIEEELEESAALSAEARHDRFVELIAQAVRGGRAIGGNMRASGEAPSMDGDA